MTENQSKLSKREAEAARQRELRRKIRENGLVEVRGYVLPEHKERCKAYLARHGVKK
jgi:hypothetical protein